MRAYRVTVTRIARLRRTLTVRADGLHAAQVAGVNAALALTPDALDGWALELTGIATVTHAEVAAEGEQAAMGLG